MRIKFILASLLLISFAASGAPPPLAGVVWQWQGSKYGNDTQAKPDDPTHYSLQLKKDGSVAARLDCNRGNGKWEESEGHKLKVEILTSTRAMCPPSSLDGKFTKDLAAVQSYLFKGGELYLQLKFDSGVMRFAKP
ncbi:hypothetical protein DJ030_01735 [bacterium endosymbiont of Escarpia laminata]|nr:MAG: hypothetical protein DJ031_10835 [bacterium endosymbiont of Escarpia laminata]RLJ22359.1 MAG: hypothetical protein DJ030_01735 [bacterium endosymbiont of Escarpia laminata]